MTSLFAKDLHSSWTPCLMNSQTLKMISLVESFLCPDKQGTPEEARTIQWPKRYENKITIKMKTIVRKRLLIKIIKLRLRNLDNWQLGIPWFWLPPIPHIPVESAKGCTCFCVSGVDLVIHEDRLGEGAAEVGKLFYHLQSLSLDGDVELGVRFSRRWLVLMVRLKLSQATENL